MRVRTRFCRRYFSSGWRIPTAVDSRKSQDSSVSNGRLKFQQRFTVSPDSGYISHTDKTGTLVWPTARCMVESSSSSKLFQDLEMLRHTTGKAVLRILELGAGCGYLGMTLASTQGHSDNPDEIILTDHAETTEWLRHNVNLNREILQGRVSVAVLEWGDESHMDAVESEFGKVDAIVGSDIIYDPKSQSALVKTLQRFAVPTFLGYPDRAGSSDFFDLLQRDADFEVEITPMLPLTFENDTTTKKMMHATCWPS